VLTALPAPGDRLVNGATGGSSNIVTTSRYGDVELYLEFLLAAKSNSGVYLQGVYEIQILDSFGVVQLKYGDCGGIYTRSVEGKLVGGRPPLVNASRPPGQWQSFHLWFQAPRFDAQGRKIAPATIYGSSSTRHDGFFEYVATPESQGYANLVTWEYPARGRLPPLKLHWYDGGMRPHRPDELDTSMELPRSGVLFVGEGGKLVAGFAGGNPYGKQGRGVPGGLLLPEEKFRGINSPPKVLARCDPADHYREWVRACKEGRPTVCPVEFGCEMTEVALLGALALRTKRLLTWDSAAARVTNHEQANAIVNPTYRDGWTL